MAGRIERARPHPQLSRAFLATVRVIFVTFLATLLAFCIGLLFGIVGVVLVKMIRGAATPGMSVAYRHVALPIALVALVVAFVVALRSEIRHYRSMRTRQNLSDSRTRAA